MATQASPETPTGQLRKHLPGGHLHPVNQVHLDEATFGERMADKVAGAIGTWRFLIGQGLVIVAWIIANILLLLNHGWDPYPFILLNLMFSIQAAYTGPVLLLAGNRSAQHDRLRLEHTAAVEEAASRVTLEILKEIEKNTETTLKVAEHLKNRRGTSGDGLTAMFARILLAVDDTYDVEETINVVAGLARAFDAEVSVYHARQRVVGATETSEKESIHDSFEFGQGIAGRLSEQGVKAAALVENARPDRLADHLLAQAEALGAELIVIGGHHAHNVRERVLGDIGRELAHRSLCPVLMMPSATRPEHS